MEMPSDEKIEKAVKNLINAGTLDEMYRVLEKNEKELLNLKAQIILGSLLETCREEALARRLKQCLEFLFHCLNKEERPRPDITRHPSRIIGITHEGHKVLMDDEGNAFVDRPDRNSLGGMEMPTNKKTERAVLELINAETLDEMYRVFEKNEKELLDPETMMLIASLLEKCGSRSEKKKLEECLEFLALCQNMVVERDHPGITRPAGKILSVTDEGVKILEDVEGDPSVVELNLDSLMGREDYTSEADTPPADKADELRELQDEINALDEPGDMPRRAELLYKMLRLIDRERNPRLWANIQAELGSSFARFPEENWAESVEKAIDHYQQALQVYSISTYSKEWAYVKGNLGAAYFKRLAGDPCENLEKGIENLEQALEVQTRESDRMSWASVQTNLGNAYSDRIKGDHAENLEKGIVHFLSALEVLSQDENPMDWANTQMNLGISYFYRIRGFRATNIEKAIECYDQALSFLSPQNHPVAWAMTKYNLGIAYTHRIMDQRSSNVEMAIGHFQDSLRVRTRDDFPMDWARTQSALGTAYSERIKGNPTGNFEKAIDLFEQSLEEMGLERSPVQWGKFHHNFGWIYAQQVKRDPDRCLRKALEHFRIALEVRTLEHYPSYFRLTQANIGQAYFSAREWGMALERYGQAIKAGEELLKGAYSDEGRAAEAGFVSPVFAHSSYCLLKMGRHDEALEMLERGKTRLLAEALILGKVDLSGVPSSLSNQIVEARRKVLELESQVRKYEAELWQVKQTEKVKHQPSSAIPLSPSLARSIERIKNIPDAVINSRKKELSDQMLIGGESLSEARRELERLIESVRSEKPDFMPTDIYLPGILWTIPEEGALVAPLATTEGSAVFVLPHGIQTVEDKHIIYLDSFLKNDIDQLAVGSLEDPGLFNCYIAYCRTMEALEFGEKGSQEVRDAHNQWLQEIEGFCSTIWDSFMGAVHEKLVELGIKKNSQVVFLQHGGFGLLPLHAACRDINGTPKAFFDDYIITYAPGAYTRSVAMNRIKQESRNKNDLFLVVDPTCDLQWAEDEGKAIKSCFEKDAIRELRGKMATPDALLNEYHGQSYLHFACHGFHEWESPMQSGLRMAGSVPLTLSEIISRLDLGSTRLVTLSACETGVIDMQLAPDEYIGLTAGFLQTGAPGVVNTLWIVSDRVTGLLMERFYSNHIKKGMHPGEALREAQIWLRDATCKQLDMAESPPDARPYSNPFYWAGFTFTGT